MTEEEKELIEKFKNLYIKDFNGEPITADDRLSYIECALITNLIEKLDKELSNIKEIEKSHKEENGKLRVELEQYKRLAEMNLKDAEEFQENMCEHRCILYNEIEELKTELFEEKEKNKEYEKQLDLDYVEKNFISKDRIMELLENEIIDISGFRCIAVEDIENLLEV